MKWTFEELREIPAGKRALEIMCYARPRFPKVVTVVDTDNKILLPKIEVVGARPGEGWIPCECSEDGHTIIGRLVVAALNELADERHQRRGRRRVDVKRVSRLTGQT